MKLIVGLGNPGKKYEHTRHNMGFDVLDLFSAMTQIEMDKEVFKGIAGKGKAFDEDLILFKPTTFMNLSGTAVQEIVHFFKIPLENIIVIYDEMALKPGQIRLRKSGSCGGHNGIRNIIEQLGTENIKRIRVGIGEPKSDSIDFVLGKPSKEEQPLIDEGVNKAAEALKYILLENFDKAMSKFN